MKANSKQLQAAARRRVQMIQQVDPFPKQAVQKYFAKRKEEEISKFKAHKKDFEERSRFSKTISAPFLDLIEPAKRRELIRAFHQRAKQHGVVKARRPEMPKMEPRIMPGSLLDQFVPPYHDLAPIQNGHSNVQANGATGYEEMFVVGDGGSSSASAGLYVLYFPLSFGGVGKFRPLIKRGSDYFLGCFGYTAHTTGTLTVRVVGLLGPAVIPYGEWHKTLWQDSVSGVVDIRETTVPWQWEGVIEVQFPLYAMPYLLSVEIGATADDNGENLLGFSYAKIETFGIQVPYMVVEETAA